MLRPDYGEGFQQTESAELVSSQAPVEQTAAYLSDSPCLARSATHGVRHRKPPLPPSRSHRTGEPFQWRPELPRSAAKLPRLPGSFSRSSKSRLSNGQVRYNRDTAVRRKVRGFVAERVLR